MCAICILSINQKSNYEADHVTPVSAGSQDGLDNIGVLHYRCHRNRGLRSYRNTRTHMQLDEIVIVKRLNLLDVSVRNYILLLDERLTRHLL